MVTKPLNQPREPLDEEPYTDESFASPSGLAVETPSPAPPPDDAASERSGPAWRVLFHITGPQPSTVGLDIWRVTVLGRADPHSAFRPDLDFAPYGAMRYGVSRRHALVRPSEHMLYLVDQNSTNGTWVNGQRLIGGREFPLSDGDIIELGALRMTVRIVQSPHQSAARETSGSGFWPRRFRFGRRRNR
ncbi:MAG TPA: FHA domain-containing protein [Chloroflexi bacterium]|nr:FHA domain-containing protein [Chloroflexota bacterium]